MVKSLIFCILLISKLGYAQLSEKSSAYNLVCYHKSKGYVLAWGNLKNQIPHGYWLLFNENGSISAKGKFRVGLRTGKWRFFDEKGQLIEKGRYRKGKKNGYWRVYEDKYVIFDDGIVVDQNVYR